MNFIAVEAGTVTAAPVCGLRPVLSLRSVVLNEPKPTRRTSVTPRARRIILAPFSEGPDRIWPYWKELARVLIDAGEEVVGVGAAKDAWAMAGICSGVAGAEPAHGARAAAEGAATARDPVPRRSGPAAPV